MRLQMVKMVGLHERDSFRKAREARIIHKAKTHEPPGINKRDEL